MTNNAKLINSVATTTCLRDRDNLDESIVDLLYRFVGAHSVALFRLIEDAAVRRLVRRAVVSRYPMPQAGATGDEGSKPPALSSLPQWQECVTNHDVVQCVGPGSHIMTLFPLGVSGERDSTGILAIEADAPLAKRDIELVRGILRLFQNHLSLLDYGELDTLTGLLNRKTFETQFEKLRRMLTLTVGNPGLRLPSWLALLDIDRFKSINDGHGHLVGDEILLLVSQIMKRSFRGADQLFRFGGEEFLVVLDQASEAGAQIALDRLRCNIEEYRFPQIGCVTVSAGYTRIVQQDIPTTCVERADAALYYAKSHGRNNVRHYESLVEAGELSGQDKTGAVDIF